MRNDLESFFSKEDFEPIFNGPDEYIYNIYRIKSYIKLKDFEKANILASRMLKENNNIEVVQLLAESHRKIGDLKSSIEILETYISVNKSEGVLRELIEDLIKSSRFSDAIKYNNQRDVYKDYLDPKKCIALQCFNKSNLLKMTLDSLIQCNGKENYSLIILQDNHIGSNYKKNYEEGYNQTRNLLKEYLPKLVDCFSEVAVIRNKINKGTAPSCRYLLDYCFSFYESAIFIEDDFILSSDALDWTDSVLPYISKESEINFASCESVFFDSKGKDIPNGELEKLELIASDNEIKNAFSTESFVPSTCFITTRDVWEKCSSIRGAIRGPESLNSWLSASNKKCLLPILPRGRDVGMLDDNGYSVAMLGKENVKEVKGTYILSKNTSKEHVGSYKKNKDLIYSATSLLNESSIEKLTASLDFIKKT